MEISSVSCHAFEAGQDSSMVKSSIFRKSLKKDFGEDLERLVSMGGIHDTGQHIGWPAML